MKNDGFTLSREVVNNLRAASAYVLANDPVEETGRVHWDCDGDIESCPEPNPTFARKARFIAAEILKMFPVPEKE